jgi:hypothetical protein
MDLGLRSQFVAVLLVAVFSSPVSAQLKINNIAVVDAAGQPTGKVVVSQPGASVTIRNDFSVVLILRITDQTTGEVLAEESIEPGTETHDHGREIGSYDIEVAIAVAPPATSIFKDCGDLTVVRP